MSASLLRALDSQAPPECCSTAPTPIVPVSDRCIASSPASLWLQVSSRKLMHAVPWVVVAALAASYIAFMALLGPANAVPMQFLAGRAAAAGLAAMNTITMFSGFLGPYWMGLTKDSTGTYLLGLRGLAIPALAGAVVMFVLTRTLRRRAPLRLVSATEPAS